MLTRFTEHVCELGSNRCGSSTTPPPAPLHSVVKVDAVVWRKGNPALQQSMKGCNHGDGAAVAVCLNDQMSHE